MVFDLHNDLLTAVRPSEIHGVLNGYESYGVRGIMLAVWTSELKLRDKDFDRFAVTAPIRTALAVEDLGSVDIGDYTDFFSSVKPAYASLTWNGENRLAGGTGFEAPLTAEGRKALFAMESARVALDLSHLSDRAFYDALDLTDGRVIVTHTASRALSAHPRNLTDEMAKLIAVRGGLIGVAAVPNFLDHSLVYGENCGRKEFLNHLSHFAELVGVSSVAIGTDFNGAEYFPEGLSDYADFAYLREDMLKAGFNAKEIDKIFYENAENFFGVKEL